MSFTIIIVAIIAGSCLLTVLFAKSARLSQTGVAVDLMPPVSAPKQDNSPGNQPHDELACNEAAPAKVYFPHTIPSELSFDGIVFGADHNAEAAPHCPTFDTYIAGVNRYVTPDDAGGLAGYAFPEPTNPVDPEAIVLYDLAGKKVGYVPARHLNNYKSKMGTGVLPWVGSTFHGSDVPLHSRVTIFDPSGSRRCMQTAVTQCCNDIEMNFGKRYVPYTVAVKPLTTA